MDWSKAADEVVKETVREGEIYLQAQLTLATSSDQRASGMASIFTAAGAAIVAGLIAVASTDVPGDKIGPIVAGGIASAAAFLTAAALCVWAVFPVGFYLPGGQPKTWARDVESGTPLRRALEEQAQNFQEKIDDNRVTLRRNATKFSWGAVFGIAAPVIGFVVWLTSSYCRLG